MQKSRRVVWPEQVERMIGGGEPDTESDEGRDLEDRLANLRARVEEALRALPVHFRSTTNIEGIQATDLFALNTLLATTIETGVVETLNMTRGGWDPLGLRAA